MDAGSQDQTPAHSTASTVPPATDNTLQMSVPWIDGYVRRQKTLPDGTVLTFRKKIRRYTRVVTGDNPDWTNAEVSVFDPGWKYDFCISPRDAIGRKVSALGKSRFGNVVIRGLTNGSPGEMTDVIMNTSNTENNPDNRSHSQADTLHGILEYEETSDGVRIKDQDLSSTSATTVKQEEV